MEKLWYRGTSVLLVVDELGVFENFSYQSNRCVIKNLFIISSPSKIFTAKFICILTKFLVSKGNKPQKSLKNIIIRS